MSICWDRDRHEREGRDAARFHRDYGWEHEERMSESRRGGPDSCERAYAEGYEREKRYQEDLRREEQEREEHELMMAERRAREEREYQEAMYLEQLQMEEEQRQAPKEELWAAEEAQS